MQTPKGEINDKIMELVKDEAVLAEMAKAGSPEACYEIVKDRIGISFEEFQSSMSVAMAYVNENSSDELSEEDLDTVAGGKGSGGSASDWVSAGAGAVGAIAGVAAAVVAAVVG